MYPPPQINGTYFQNFLPLRKIFNFCHLERSSIPPRTWVICAVIEEVAVRELVKERYKSTLDYAMMFSTYICFKVIKLRPRHSSGGLSPTSHRGGPGSNPGLVMWDFVMEKSGAGAGFLQELRVSPANLHSICFSTIIFTITRGWHNRPGVSAVPIASQTK
jgi:hypothetical protein